MSNFRSKRYSSTPRVYVTDALVDALIESRVLSLRERTGKNWVMMLRRSDAGGLCHFRTSEILIPRRSDPIERLYYYLHEEAHALMHDNLNESDLTRVGPDWQLEWEADRQAIAEMRTLGFPVSQSIVRSAKDNVAQYAAAVPEGKVPRRVARWLGDRLTLARNKRGADRLRRRWKARLRKRWEG